MTIVAIHQPQYLPWLPYLSKVAQCDVFVYLDNVQFQKNGVQNRNQIKTANGPAWLTVPVRASMQVNIGQTPIDNSQHWRQKHLRSIENAYARAPFKGLLEEGLRQILESEWNYLGDLNIAVTEWMFKQLDIRCERVRSSDINASGLKDDLVLSICREVGGRTYLSGNGAKAYQDPEKFREQGIELTYQHVDNRQYPQCFAKTGFLPALSGLDLILNVGDKARGYL